MTRRPPEPAIKPVKAWGYVTANGRLIGDTVKTTKSEADLDRLSGERVARVLITVIDE